MVSKSFSLHGNCRPEFKTEKDNAPMDSKVPRASLSDGKITSSLIIPKLMLFNMHVVKLKKCHLPLIYIIFFLLFENDITWFVMKKIVCVLHKFY